ncbi:Outer membrane protein TolC [Lutibacter agarilyticus]|uniref:Outer membrane protein TolC n=1 Tax=Lutibacter agarilyticus TaxID=1109740 RepID=A0A238X8Q6_9FLAO|nr:TolC family protein [Lutibacter agarilyticus]SNR55337.1 Outer membrane protein TolC [Lutibacter agarilyticus]
MKKYLILLLGIATIQLNAQESLSLSLDDAIAYALENSYASINATRDLELSKQKNKETVAFGLPQINANFDYQHWIKQQVSLIPAEFGGGNSGDFIEIVFGTKNSLSASATLSQVIFDGSYIVGLKYLDTYMQISRDSKEKTELAIREAVINAYGNVLFTEEGISILKKNVETLEKNLTETNQIYLNGFAEEESVEQLKLTLASLKTTLNKSQKLKNINYKMFNITIGADINTNTTLTDNLDELTKENIQFSLLSNDFNIEDHIDFRIAENQVEGKEAVVKLEKSKALPTLNSFVNFGYQGYSDTFSFHESQQEWFDSSLLGVNLSVPIFSGLARSARTQQAKVEYDKAKTSFEETSQKILLELETAKVTYQYSVEEFETSKQNLALAERIEKKQEIKFFEGISTSFDLTNAQNQLYTMQQNYLQAMLNVIAAKAGLDKALNTPISN